MNYLLKIYDSKDLIIHYERNEEAIQMLKDAGEPYDHLVEHSQDILEILNHRGVRLKL